MQYLWLGTPLIELNAWALWKKATTKTKPQYSEQQVQQLNKMYMKEVVMVIRICIIQEFFMINADQTGLILIPLVTYGTDKKQGIWSHLP